MCASAPGALEFVGFAPLCKAAAGLLRARESMTGASDFCVERLAGSPKDRANLRLDAIAEPRKCAVEQDARGIMAGGREAAGVSRIRGKAGGTEHAEGVQEGSRGRKPAAKRTVNAAPRRGAG